VVGGLVEQQQRGFLQEQLGESDSHLPAAGELGLALPVLREGGRRARPYLIEGVDVMEVELVNDLR
jgi:hypothetical protein